jgi:DEAD/DEAH box helicase domain-containing protein
MNTGILTRQTTHIFANWTLYDHQERATRRLVAGLPTIIASSTGSGKTEAFLLPIIDYCIRHKATKGTKAVLIYPMNALANDQLKRLRRLLKMHMWQPIQ